MFTPLLSIILKQFNLKIPIDEIRDMYNMSAPDLTMIVEQPACLAKALYGAVKKGKSLLDIHISLRMRVAIITYLPEGASRFLHGL